MVAITLVLFTCNAKEHLTSMKTNASSIGKHFLSGLPQRFVLQQLSRYVILVILFLFSQKIYHDITSLLRIVVFCWEIRIPAVFYVVFCPLGCVIVLNK